MASGSGHSLNFPAPAAGIQLVNVPGKGRGLRATTNFRPGDLLIDEEPFSAVVLSEVLERQPVCGNDFVLLADKDLSRCTACKSVRYSSKAAQKSDWVRGHKYECKALRFSGSVPHTVVRLVARILWKRVALLATAAQSGTAADGQREDRDTPAGREGESSKAPSGLAATEQTFWNSYNSVAGLQGNEKALSRVQQAAMPDMLHGLRAYMAHSTVPHASDWEMQKQLILRILGNAFTIHEPRLADNHGLGLYTFGAMLNHSSRPCCGQAFHKGRLQVRALRPIKAGEELCISYTLLDHPTFEHRRELLSRYCFDIRPELPARNVLPEKLSAEIGGCVRASILDDAVSSILAADHIDAAHCAFHFSPVGDSAAPPEAHGRLASSTAATPASRFCTVKLRVDMELEGLGLRTEGVEGSDAVTSRISLVTARQILRESWLPDDAGCAWLDQVMVDGWMLVVQLFGQWQPSDEETWQAAAHGAAFAHVAQVWSQSLHQRGEHENAHKLALKAERSGREAGLADSHTIMRQALQGLVEWFIQQPVRGPQPSEDDLIFLSLAQRYEAGSRAVFPPVWGGLGWVLDEAGEVAVRCGRLQEGLQLWQEAFRVLQGAFGQDRSVLRVHLKHEYFRDRNLGRRLDLTQRFGQDLSSEVS